MARLYNKQFFNNQIKGTEMSARKIFLGVVAGAAVGAILGVLFAPAKGSVTRKRVSQTASNFAEDVSKLTEDLKGKVD
jgi:gas vesicle protein